MAKAIYVKTIGLILCAVLAGGMAGCSQYKKTSDSYKKESDSVKPTEAKAPDSDTVLTVAENAEETSDSATIPSPPPTSPATSRKTLNELMDLISKRFQETDKENPLRQNINWFGTTSDMITVSLLVNTVHWQNEFRKQISDSPLIRFEGPSKPQPIKSIVKNDTILPGIRILPDKDSFPANTKEAAFTIENTSDKSIQFGEKFVIGYKGADNEWLKLPSDEIWNDIALGLSPGKKYEFKANMRLLLNRNKPGIYRLYKEIKIEGEDDSFWIMTEFRLI